MGQMAQALATAKNAYKNYFSRRALGFSGPRAELIFAETLIATGQVEHCPPALSESFERNSDHLPQQVSKLLPLVR